VAVFRQERFLSLSLAGLDAFERVLKKVRHEGVKDFGHSYKLSSPVEPGPESVKV
jgi:hypothetical protein